MRRITIAVMVCAVAVSACAPTPSTSTVTTERLATSRPTPNTGFSTTTGPVVTSPDIGGRPFEVVAPSSYDRTVALPLVILLHGLGITGAMQDDFFRFRAIAESHDFLMVSPDGTRNADNFPFWNATDVCCGFGDAVDDSAYLAAVIEQVRAAYTVDAKRVFLIGYSNGGFMSYRMACDHADLIAGIVSISAATFLDPSMCAPSSPVNVLAIHGTDDETIAYSGGTFEGTAHPGAPASVAQLAAFNSCAGPATTTGAARDLDRELVGRESSVTTYRDCPVGGAVELWTIPGGAHVPELSTTFSQQIIDHLLAHPKP